MTLSKSFTEEAVTDGTIKGLNPGFRVFLERLGRIDVNGSLAEARRILLDADRMVRDLNARIEQCRAEYDALLERQEAAMEGHGPAVPPGALEAARDRAEAAEEVARLLSDDHSEQVWREHLTDMQKTWKAIQAEANASEG